MSDETNVPEEESRENVLEYLKRQRDELKLQMHLGSKDARDQWEKLEDKWKEVEEWAEPLTSATREAASTAGEQAKKITGAALDVAAREIKSGYQKLRKMLE